MLALEDREWNKYLAHLDDKGCLCEEDECICLSDRDFEDFIIKNYEDSQEHLGECV
jgi:hypothetical protein